jgi:hypothetical protein
MLLHESRRAARVSPEGDLILLEDQDRSLWNREQITEGIALVRGALMSSRLNQYTLQATIAAVHAIALLRRHGLEFRLRSVRSAGANGSVTGGRDQPRRGSGDA